MQGVSTSAKLRTATSARHQATAAARLASDSLSASWPTAGKPGGSSPLGAVVHATTLQIDLFAASMTLDALTFVSVIVFAIRYLAVDLRSRVNPHW